MITWDVGRRVSACAGLAATALLATPAVAQRWNDPRVLALVQDATERRARQLADSGLVDYRASAHGYLTFLAQLGEGFREPPRVVKADELALQVYWRSPNLSKQRIVGRRDTTLLPTDIEYHRDHLGIVQNNFPAIIRLGDGDEVRDVPHPLSASGLAAYDFAIADSLRITIPGRVIGVYEVKIRPKNDRLPRVIGALYLDRDNAQVVRMALSFTRAAFLDKQLEDLFIVLENGLVGTHFWLPRRQEIEIRRTATWLEYPIRAIIRGRWEISDYELNTNFSPSIFVGPEIAQAPIADQRAHTWPTRSILDSLPPDVRAVTDDEVRRVQAEVRALVREQALRRVRGSALAARGVSDFARFNRVEGVAVGGGLSWRFGGGVGLSGQVRHGFSDHRFRGRAEASWQNAAGVKLSLAYMSDMLQTGSVPERSGLVNSIAAQEFASDDTDPYGVDGGTVALEFTGAGLRWSLAQSLERHYSLDVHAVPASGTFRQPIVVAGGGWRTTLVAELPTTLTLLGVEARGRAEGRFFAKEDASSLTCPTACAATRSLRLSAVLELERPFGAVTLATRTIGSGVTASDAFPVQELSYLGGPVSAPGYRFHDLTGQGALSQRLELRVPVPFVGFSLGRFGRSPPRAKAALYGLGVLLSQVPLDREVSGVPAPWNPADPLRPRESGFYPSAGVGLLTFFDLLRFDVAHGFRDGRWIFSLDVTPAFWSVL
jgi:hypothetical protein